MKLKNELPKKILKDKAPSGPALSRALDIFDKYDLILNGLLSCPGFEALKSFITAHDSDYDECRDALVFVGYEKVDAVNILDSINHMYIVGWLSDHPSDYNKLTAWLSA